MLPTQAEQKTDDTPELEQLQIRIDEADDTSRAIRGDDADGGTVSTSAGDLKNFAADGAEQPYRMLLEMMNEGAAILMADNSIAYCNRSLAEMLKTPIEKLIGAPLETCAAPDHRLRLRRLIERAVTSPAKGVFRFAAGCEIAVWAELSLCPAMLGDAAGICVAALDVTERRKKVERMHAALERRVAGRTAELAAANRELEAFSYSVSHDLRAPLRAMDGFARALLEDYAEKLDLEGKDLLQRVRAASQRMDRLIDGMLLMSRTTRAAMHRTAVDVSALARTVALELQRSNAGREVQFVIAPGLIVNADPELLRAALQNLLGNAWKFTSKHPRARIEVGSVQDKGETVFFVRDDGAGFEMAYAGKLFGAFQRLHTPAEFEGTGVGLASVQRIIRRHGGRIWAEGKVEKGATFFFTLPNLLHGRFQASVVDCAKVT